MKWMTFRGVVCLLVFLSGTGVCPAQARDEGPELGWFNATDLSVVLTSGNSAARTFGFANRLQRVWRTSRLQLDVNGVRSATSDDRFYLVDPGIAFLPGDAPEDPAFRLVKPGPRSELEHYLVGGRYDRNITERFFWNAGGSWDRNENAGILNRYILFAGVGNTWSNTEDREFSTSYGVSYTDRAEEQPDPLKGRRFGGARLGWHYLNRLGSVTVFESDFTTNINLANVSDNSFQHNERGVDHHQRSSFAQSQPAVAL